MNIEILDRLISEGESLFTTITFVPAGANVIRTFSVYKSSEQDRYQNWKSAAQRFVKTFHPSDLDDIKKASEKISPDNHRVILGVLKAIKLLPDEPATSIDDKRSATNNINITNTQNVSQQLSINLFLDAVKEEITGKQLREIKEILKAFEEPEEKRSKILEKIKGFGGDVLSNIVANILTNPTIYNGLF